MCDALATRVLSKKPRPSATVMTATNIQPMTMTPTDIVSHKQDQPPKASTNSDFDLDMYQMSLFPFDDNDNGLLVQFLEKN